MSQFPLYFTYCLTYIPTGQRYYGCRYGKKSHPDTLWNTYFTSSKVVKDLIKKTGKESFRYEIRKTFNDPLKCYFWEDRVLKKLHVSSNPNWLNESENTSSRNGYFASKYKTEDSKRKMSLARIGKKLSPQTCEKLSKSKKGQTWSIKRKASPYSEIGRDKQSSNWLITNPNGLIFQIKNLKKFCRYNNLDSRCMQALSTGKRKNYQNWKCSKLV